MREPFGDVIGHPGVVRLLGEDLAHPAQAYLFVGPSNVGKAAVARRFAAALLCAEDERCMSRAIRGAHPDLTVVEPLGTASITVDQARATVSQASLSPLEGSRKIFLFEEAGILNEEAANALLKTLEEPTASTIFILVAESEDDLPATIASRCRSVVFGRVAEEEVSAGLEAQGVDPDQAADAARISGGRPGLAIGLATQPEVAGFRRLWLSVPLRLSEHPGEAFLLADEVSAAARPLVAALEDRQKSEVERLEAEGGAGRALRERHQREMKRATISLYVTGLEILAGFYRDAAAAQLGGRARNPDIPVASLTRVLPSDALANAERVLDTIDALRSNQRPQLAFAALFSQLASNG